METLINELIYFLIEEKNIYDKYLALSIKKKDAIIKGDITSLDIVISEEKNIYNEITSLEEKRKLIISEISDDENITISEIANMTNDKIFIDKVNSLVSEFQKTIKEISVINQINQSLIKRNLNYIGYMINTVMTDDTIYNYNGLEETPSQKLNIFNKRV